MRVPKNITRHELIGLGCTVAKASNKSHTGIEGKIVDETMKTIIIKCGGKNKRIPKQGTVFRVKLGDKDVDIDGNHLVARPEDRIKKKFRKW